MKEGDPGPPENVQRKAETKVVALKIQMAPLAEQIVTPRHLIESSGRATVVECREPVVPGHAGVQAEEDLPFQQFGEDPVQPRVDGIARGDKDERAAAG